MTNSTHSPYLSQCCTDWPNRVCIINRMMVPVKVVAKAADRAAHHQSSSPDRICSAWLNSAATIHSKAMILPKDIYHNSRLADCGKAKNENGYQTFKKSSPRVLDKRFFFAPYWIWVPQLIKGNENYYIAC